MKIGMHIRLSDGREATVVFNGLSGVGIMWGLHDPPEEDFDGTFGDLFDPLPDAPCLKPGWPWHKDAMLREAESGGFDMATRLGVPCVGEDYIVLDHEVTHD